MLCCKLYLSESVIDVKHLCQPLESMRFLVFETSLTFYLKFHWKSKTMPNNNKALEIDKRKGKNGPRNRFLKNLCNMYYRYSVETGICALEWWEAVLVNLYFVLLIYSLVRQTISTGIILFRSLLHFTETFVKKTK